MNQTKFDQSELTAMIHGLERNCAVLISALNARGDSIPAAPQTSAKDVVAKFADYELYHALLTNQLAKHPATTAPAAAAPGASAAAPVAPAAKIAATDARLSADETKALKAASWTALVQYAGGKISPGDARAVIAAAAKSKAATVKPNITARMLAAKGCKTLAEARSKAASAAFPLTD